jgi:hypothetical protein
MQLTKVRNCIIIIIIIIIITIIIIIIIRTRLAKFVTL